MGYVRNNIHMYCHSLVSLGTFLAFLRLEKVSMRQDEAVKATLRLQGINQMRFTFIENTFSGRSKCISRVQKTHLANEFRV